MTAVTTPWHSSCSSQMQRRSLTLMLCDEENHSEHKSWDRFPQPAPSEAACRETSFPQASFLENVGNYIVDPELGSKVSLGDNKPHTHCRSIPSPDTSTTTILGRGVRGKQINWMCLSKTILKSFPLGLPQLEWLAKSIYNFILSIKTLEFSNSGCSLSGHVPKCLVTYQLFRQKSWWRLEVRSECSWPLTRKSCVHGIHTL